MNIIKFSQMKNKVNVYEHYIYLNEISQNVNLILGIQKT